MRDRLPTHPGRVRLTPVSGQSGVYDMVMADDPSEVGTPLNKASLLKDATASKFGLGSDAVPDDVFNAIKTLINDANANANAKARIVTGSYVGTGTYGNANPNRLTFDFEPKIVVLTEMISSGGAYYVLFGNSETRQGVFAIYPERLSDSFAGDRGFLIEDNTTSNSFAKREGTSVLWYNSRTAHAQGNGNGWTYHYIAIG